MNKFVTLQLNRAIHIYIINAREEEETVNYNKLLKSKEKRTEAVQQQKPRHVPVCRHALGQLRLKKKHY